MERFKYYHAFLNNIMAVTQRRHYTHATAQKSMLLQYVRVAHVSI
jgi:hypothetical protein